MTLIRQSLNTRSRNTGERWTLCFRNCTAGAASIGKRLWADKKQSETSGEFNLSTDLFSLFIKNSCSNQRKSATGSASSTTPRAASIRPQNFPSPFCPNFKPEDTSSKSSAPSAATPLRSSALKPSAPKTKRASRKSANVFSEWNLRQSLTRPTATNGIFTRSIYRAEIHPTLRDTLTVKVLLFKIGNLITSISLDSRPVTKVPKTLLVLKYEKVIFRHL